MACNIIIFNHPFNTLILLQLCITNDDSQTINNIEVYNSSCESSLLRATIEGWSEGLMYMPSRVCHWFMSLGEGKALTSRWPWIGRPYWSPVTCKNDSVTTFLILTLPSLRQYFSLHTTTQWSPSSPSPPSPKALTSRLCDNGDEKWWLCRLRSEKVTSTKSVAESVNI